jgi:hypothetical protein
MKVSVTSYTLEMFPLSNHHFSYFQSQMQGMRKVLYQSTHAVIQLLFEETAATNGIQYTTSL